VSVSELSDNCGNAVAGGSSGSDLASYRLSGANRDAQQDLVLLQRRAWASGGNQTLDVADAHGCAANPRQQTVGQPTASARAAVSMDARVKEKMQGLSKVRSSWGMRN